jgi:hypothetical protein
MKRILSAAVLAILAIASFSALAAQGNPLPSFNDFAPVQETVNEPCSSAAIDQATLPQPSFRDYVLIERQDASQASTGQSSAPIITAGIPAPSAVY